MNRLTVIWQSFGIIVEYALTQAIRAAVLEERERCAKIAESFIPSGFGGSFGIARDDRARAIAAKIRREE